MKRNKKLIVGLMIVGALVLIFLLGSLYSVLNGGGIIPQNKFISLSCPNCNFDPLYLDDCVGLQKQNKDNPEVKKLAEELGITKTTRIEKQIQLHITWDGIRTNKVTCLFWEK